MPKCLNDPKKRYTGNEMTPLGKGYTATKEKVGKRMKGTDGNMYVVTKSGKNKRWTKMGGKKQGPMSPMSRRRRDRRRKSSRYEDESSDEEEYYYTSSSDEEEDDLDDVEWKLEAAEERCKLSDVLCSETLLVNVAFLAWNYFKDWYRRVRYGEDPYLAYEDVTMLK